MVIHQKTSYESKEAFNTLALATSLKQCCNGTLPSVAQLQKILKKRKLITC